MNVPTCLALKSTSVVCSWRTIIGFSAIVVEEPTVAAKGSARGGAAVVIESRVNILVTDCIFDFDRNVS